MDITFIAMKILIYFIFNLNSKGEGTRNPLVNEKVERLDFWLSYRNSDLSGIHTVLNKEMEPSGTSMSSSLHSSVLDYCSLENHTSDRIRSILSHCIVTRASVYLHWNYGKIQIGNQIIHSRACIQNMH